MQKLKNIKQFSPTWRIAHRGFSRKYPENTLAAFEAAATDGVQMIELDVMLSRDRRPVVIHDPTLGRTTNGQGAVNDYTLDELKQLDAGSWFDEKFADQRLPELSEVLDLLKGRVYVNIEIKAGAYEGHHPPDAIEKQIVAMVRKKNLQDTVLISSFEIEFLVQIAAMEDPPAIALISHTPVTKRIVEICKHLNLFSWHPDQRIATWYQIKLMHTAGLKVFPYRVDTFEDYRRMMDMTVEGVITDDPVAARKWSLLRSAA
jgi:glycerophosphoryl diester phosphodiesterase